MNDNHKLEPRGVPATVITADGQIKVRIETPNLSTISLYFDADAATIEMIDAMLLLAKAKVLP